MFEEVALLPACKIQVQIDSSAFTQCFKLQFESVNVSLLKVWTPLEFPRELETLVCGLFRVWWQRWMSKTYYVVNGYNNKTLYELYVIMCFSVKPGHHFKVRMLSVSMISFLISFQTNVFTCAAWLILASVIHILLIVLFKSCSELQKHHLKIVKHITDGLTFSFLFPSPASRPLLNCQGMMMAAS